MRCRPMMIYLDDESEQYLEVSSWFLNVTSLLSNTIHAFLSSLSQPYALALFTHQQFRYFQVYLPLWHHPMTIPIPMSLMLRIFKPMFYLACPMALFCLPLTWLNPEYRESEDILYINSSIFIRF